MNLEKFKDVQSEILEVAAHTWILALANVNTDPSNILNCPASEVLRGYAFPDPFLFISAKMPLPQHWRGYLIKVGQSVGVSFGLAGSLPSRSDTNVLQSRKKMRVEKFREEVDNIFDLALDLHGTLPDLYWRGSIIKPAASPVTTLMPLAIVKEIIWEVIENNWWLEILALDRILISQFHMS